MRAAHHRAHRLAPATIQPLARQIPDLSAATGTDGKRDRRKICADSQYFHLSVYGDLGTDVMHWIASLHRAAFAVDHLEMLSIDQFEFQIGCAVVAFIAFEGDGADMVGDAGLAHVGCLRSCVAAGSV